ncbi:MAG: hypothetical protein UY23_C0001G0331 [Candidatus Jorgensenbacteria bacterium GW2011_GWA1_48_11]|uniref:Uncharacterized protein n=1 Tax=Candidatus Jorgensenbacteria bacterium GW2011_GWA1_48_11 TaxID=1618660 RepID=A0A0G1XBP9_9BACT|nr:MAG: hypothetical protein UY23_C0001G0331 [Candidatus Jorgensenbacteria bacterium GW2011_GWA1_48_11]KKW12216.1 MAG: hypothetical protein UY51_C0005G0458 [Candidatus Jorgensenbacteria bacterium GW2011_GWB1_49_9]
MSKNFVITLVVISLIVGFGLGWYFNGAKYQSQIKAVSENLPDVGVVSKTPEVITSISATVKSRDGNALIITVQPSSNPFENWPLERRAVIGEDTELVKRVVKDSAVYEAEKKAYARNPIGQYPGPYEDVPIKADEINAGASIVVESGENIKFAETITPTLIRVLL